jgi:hypothetical protein
MRTLSQALTLQYPKVMFIGQRCKQTALHNQILTVCAVLTVLGAGAAAYYTYQQWITATDVETPARIRLSVWIGRM